MFRSALPAAGLPGSSSQKVSSLLNLVHNITMKLTFEKLY